MSGAERSWCEEHISIHGQWPLTPASLAQDGDFSPVYDLAKALMTVQRAFGTIPRIIGKGESAQVSRAISHATRWAI